MSSSKRPSYSSANNKPPFILTSKIALSPVKNELKTLAWLSAKKEKKSSGLLEKKDSSSRIKSLDSETARQKQVETEQNQVRLIDFISKLDYNIPHRNKNKEKRLIYYTVEEFKDIKDLVSCYKTDDDMVIEQDVEVANKEKKVLKKFKIKQTLDDEQINATLNNFRSRSKQPTTEPSCDTLFTETFNDPLSALRTLKTNQKIIREITIINNKRKREAYMEKFKEYTDFVKCRQLTSKDLVVKTKNMNDKQAVKLISKSRSDKIQVVTEKRIAKDILFKKIEFKGKLIRNNYIRPEARTQAAMCTDGKSVYLFGGLGRGLMNDLWNCCSNYKWTKTKNSENLILARYGHTMVHYEGYLVIFGGAVSREDFIGLEDLLICSIETKTFGKRETSGNGKIDSRRLHSAVVNGHHMIVFGGLIQNGSFAKAYTYALDLKRYVWEVIEVIDDKSPGPMHSHSACLVFREIKKEFNLFEPHTSSNSQREEIFEGMYIFGGERKNKKESNELYLLNFDSYPASWHFIPTNGGKPEARKAASLVFLFEIKCLCLTGGSRLTEKSVEVFADLYLLNLASFVWCKVNVFDDRLVKRQYHNMCLLEDKLVIFGGTEENKFIEGVLHEISLEFYENKETKGMTIAQNAFKNVVSKFVMNTNLTKNLKK